MTITASCPHCASPFSFDDSQLGTVGSCPACQGQIMLAVPVPNPPPAAAPVAVRKAPSAPSQMVINGNVVQLGGTAYQLSQINSVRVQPGRFRPIAFLMVLLFGFSLLGSGAILLTPTEHSKNGIDEILWKMSAFYLLFFAAALYRFVDGLRRCKLMLTVSSGELAALESCNRRRLEAIASDLVGAISAR